MGDRLVFKNLREASLNDATVYRMLLEKRPVEEIVVQLVSEKTALMRELGRIKMMQQCPMLILQSDELISEVSEPAKNKPNA